jgi:Ca2+-binding RTX toxin-like protein
MVANSSDSINAAIAPSIELPLVSELDLDLLSSIDAEAVDLNQAIARNPRLATLIKAILDSTLGDGDDVVRPPVAIPPTPAPDPGRLNFIFGTAASETLNGTAGNDAIYGFAGDDVLNGKAGNDRLFGGLGDDVLNGDEGNDSLDGGTGDDLLLGGSGNDQLFGRAGNDVLDGGSGNDQLLGESGDDVLLGSTGDDTLNGGAGTDIADYSGFSNAVTIQSTGKLFKGTAGTDSLVDVEIIFGSEGKANTIDGSTTMAPASLDVDLSINSLKVNGLPSLLQFTVKNFVNVTGTGQDDIILGDSGNNQIEGAAGNDRLQGGAGNDIINGGAGDDDIEGGDGNDTLNGGTGNDSIVDFAGTTNTVVASTGNDTIDVINSVVDYRGLKGGIGVSVRKRGMDDRGVVGLIAKGVGLNEPFGSDSFLVSPGELKVNANDFNYLDNSFFNPFGAGGNGAPLIVDLSDFSGGAFNRARGSVSRDTIIGNSNRNVLIAFGISGATGDVLNGQGGDDVLVGSRTGGDILTGGAGVDRFELTSILYPSDIITMSDFVPVNGSTITDFDVAAGETIKISPDSGLPTGVLSASAFEVVTSGSAATRESTRLIYNKTVGELYFDFNGSGTSGAPFGFDDSFLLAKLSNKAELSASSFVVGNPTSLFA